jgi:hypothetical protein
VALLADTTADTTMADKPTATPDDARWQTATGPGPSEPITDTRPLPEAQIGPPDARPIVDDLGAVAAVVRGAAAVLETAGSTDTFADHGTPDTPDTETTP